MARLMDSPIQGSANAVIEIPGYQIKREIGQGGMASVHLAVQTSLERQVALKVMSPALAADPAFTRRFLQEARTLASLAHANIVQVFDVGVTPNQLHYFSMQYLAGGDFITRVQRGMDEAELKRVLIGVARALAYAHERGYVHRDVAPGNILFDSADNPVLTDFGIALAASQSTRITSTGFSVGTSHYMSPEQARGGDLDARSDLYSLGVLAWYGLTGKPPYDGNDGFAVAYAHVFEPIPRLSENLHWQELIDRCLAKDPKDRYANAEQVLAAIDAIPVARGGKSGEATAKPVDVAAPAKAVAAAAPAKAEAAKPAAPTRPVAKPAAKPAATSPAASSGSRSGGGLWLGLAAVGVLGAAGLGGYVWWTSRDPAAAPVAPAAAASVAPAAVTAAPSATPAPEPVAPAAATEPAPAETGSAPAVPANPATSGTDAAIDSLASLPPETPSPEAMAGTEELPALPSGPTPLLMEDGEPANLADVPTVEDPVQKLVRLARADLKAQRYAAPPEANALDRFRLALRIDAKDKNAKQGITDTAKAYYALGNKDYGGGNLAGMKTNFDKALEIAALIPEAKPVADEVRQRRSNLATPLLEEARAAASAWDKAKAKSAYDKALALDPGNVAAQEGLRKLPSIGSAGYVFRDKLDDGGQGPEMVVLPGTKLAAGRYEISRGDFRRYWNGPGKSTKEVSCRDRESVFRSSKKRSWQNPDIDQDDSHPVVCVSFEQANGYVRWLSQRSGKTYRLMTSAEFDTFARESRGNSCNAANLADSQFNKAFDSRAGASCDDGFAGTAPGGRFGASASGLYDVDGNVREWVSERRARGRSWLSPPDKEAADANDSVGADVALNSLGLRVVREL